MRDFAVRRLRPSLPWFSLAVFGVTLLCGSTVVVGAAIDPPPDPAGIATGDKSAAIDGAGNPFVVRVLRFRMHPDHGVLPNPAPRACSVAANGQAA